MANITKKLSTNVPGNFFVDSTCIDCDTCRQLAPTVFVEEGEYSVVHHQPENEQELHHAYQALLACPVGCIGAVSTDKHQLQHAMSSFPMHLERDVYYAGFNSEKSFGANSYFVRHPAGNWLIDSPRYVRHLLDAFHRMGGIRYIFLTHEDDVADSARYAKEFGATRIIHGDDADAMPDAEWKIEGWDSREVTSQFWIIPVPGHTSGSMALLYDNRFLFTGDHMWWEPDEKRLGVPSTLIWRDHHLRNSTERLLDYDFEWVLPGHGDRTHLQVRNMKEALLALIQRRWPQRA
jgi:glyoxylase-like metal-dependent hydrolase (beta-lactamase superfamily II)/ferredoxin